MTRFQEERIHSIKDVFMNMHAFSSSHLSSLLPLIYDVTESDGFIFLTSICYSLNFFSPIAVHLILETDFHPRLIPISTSQEQQLLFTDHLRLHAKRVTDNILLKIHTKQWLRHFLILKIIYYQYMTAAQDDHISLGGRACGYNTSPFCLYPTASISPCFCHFWVPFPIRKLFLLFFLSILCFQTLSLPSLPLFPSLIFFQSPTS